MKVLITGATGFIGGCLSEYLTRNGCQVAAVSRRAGIRSSSGIIFHQVQDLYSENLAWLVEGQDVVVHCAARVHLMNDASADPLTEFRNANLHGTLSLARQAAVSGVKRFIFISSIKVNGEATELDKPYTADDDPAPVDYYGISKLEAEKALLELAADTGLEVTIIRPVLVYGRGAKGNFFSLSRLVEKGIPLPFGAIYNKRSLLGIENLIDLIALCLDHPAAANQVFLAADGEDLSTTELLRSLAVAMGRPSRLIPVPRSLLRLSATLLGREAVAQRLLGSLQVDISKTRKLLGWQPPVSVEEGLKRCFGRKG